MKPRQRRISASFIGSAAVRSPRVVEQAKGWLLEYARTRHRLTPIERTRGDEQVIRYEQLGELSRWGAGLFAAALGSSGPPEALRTISAETSWLLQAVRLRSRLPRELRIGHDSMLRTTELLIGSTMHAALCVGKAFAAVARSQALAAVRAAGAQHGR